MSDEGSYEIDSYKENEWKTDDWEDIHDVTCGGGGPKVVVELPPNLLPPNSSSSEKERSFERSSEGSSFISISKNDGQSSSCIKSEPISNNQTNHTSNNDHKSEVETLSSYVHQMKSLDIESLTEYQPSNCKSYALSSSSETVISGFSYIDLNGSSAVRCKRCTFLNEPPASQVQICLVCSFPLTANPCVDIDEQVAKHLQLEEEKAAFKDVIANERKRRFLSNYSIFERTQFLVEEIEKIISYWSKGDAGIIPLRAADLTIHVSDMIEKFDVLKENGVISLSFLFNRLDQKDSIRLYGLTQSRLNASTEADCALKFAMSDDSPEPGKIDLGQIQPPEKQSSQEGEEESALKDVSPLKDDYVGWIVAYVQSGATDHAFHSGITTVNLLSKCYPLLTFAADMQNPSNLQRLLSRLQEACHDFFLTDWNASSTKHIFDEEPNKKIKLNHEDSKLKSSEIRVAPPCNDSFSFGELLDSSLELDNTNTNLLSSSGVSFPSACDDADLLPTGESLAGVFDDVVVLNNDGGLLCGADVAAVHDEGNK